VRGLATGALSLVAGCGLLSGLDTLTIDDGGQDADAGTADVIGTDTTLADAPPNDMCARDAGNPKCFSAIACTSMETCCVTATTASCIGAVGCQGDTLACTDPSGCTVSGTDCCLETYALETSSCPWVIINPQGGDTPKTVCGQCDGTEAGGPLRVCNQDADCPMGLHCHTVVLGIKSDTRFGVCN
jgi:hypothetical protein